mgnify:CR=1 FL=1
MVEALGDIIINSTIPNNIKLEVINDENFAVKLTIEWYKEFYENKKRNLIFKKNLTKKQILDYHKKFKI